MAAAAPLRGALIGCGNVARHHLEAWSRLDEARITGLCEVDRGRLAAALAKAPTARGYRDAEALFDDGPFDFVEICTGPTNHCALVELAARHRVHVLCQKPVAATRSELRAMIDRCDEAGVRFMVHENWRFRPWNRALRGEIEAGTIGRPIRLRLAHRDTRALRADGFAEQPFLATRERLILMEMGCHLVDTARFLLGEIETVHATTGRFGKGHSGDDVATLSVTFVGGALGLLDMSWCAPPDIARPEWALNETAVEGSAGALKLDVDGSLRRVDLRGRVERRAVPLPPSDQVYVAAFAATQQHFLDGLLRGIPHETDGRDTLRTMDVVWAAYRSAGDGTTVSL
jgi:predicted dehydrogenase